MTETPTPDTSDALTASETALTAPETGWAPSIWNDRSLMADAYRAAKYLAASDLVPEATYRNKPANCLIALDMANRLNIQPLIVMQNLYIVKGKPGWSGQFCIAAINGCGKFSPLEYIWSDGGGGCTCRAVRLSDGKVCQGTTVTMQMASDEGWLSKSGSKWKSMPQQMMMYRAAAFFARTYCPEVLLGIQTADEIADVHGADQTEASVVTITLPDKEAQPDD
jgi:hypothetical protein